MRLCSFILILTFFPFPLDANLFPHDYFTTQVFRYVGLHISNKNICNYKKYIFKQCYLFGLFCKKWSGNQYFCLFISYRFMKKVTRYVKYNGNIQSHKEI